MSKVDTSVQAVEEILFQDRECFTVQADGRYTIKLRGIPSQAQQFEIDRIFEDMEIEHRVTLDQLGSRTFITLPDLTLKQDMALEAKIDDIINRQRRLRMDQRVPGHQSMHKHFPAARGLKERAELFVFSEGWEEDERYVNSQGMMKEVHFPLGSPMIEAMEDVLQGEAQKRLREFSGFGATRLNAESCLITVKNYIYDDVLKPVINQLQRD